jgi:plastocyanin domain-containing protein
MLRISLAFAVAVGLGLGGCNKESKAKPAPSQTAPSTAGTVGADGVRKVAIEAGKDGYVPDRIAGKPGEKLVLVFTRTVEASCIDQLKTPDGKVVALPKGTPVEVAVTVPASGEVGFACSMDMYRGKVVADKG